MRWPFTSRRTNSRWLVRIAVIIVTVSTVCTMASRIASALFEVRNSTIAGTENDRATFIPVRGACASATIAAKAVTASR